MQYIKQTADAIYSSQPVAHSADRSHVCNLAVLAEEATASSGIQVARQAPPTYQPGPDLVGSVWR